MSAINKNKLYFLIKIFRRVFGGVSYRLNIFSNSSFAYVLRKFLKGVNVTKHFLMFRRANMRINGENFNLIFAFSAAS